MTITPEEAVSIADKAERDWIKDNMPMVNGDPLGASYERAIVRARAIIEAVLRPQPLSTMEMVVWRKKERLDEAEIKRLWVTMDFLQERRLKLLNELVEERLRKDSLTPAASLLRKLVEQLIARGEHPQASLITVALVQARTLEDALCANKFHGSDGV